ncbi:MAG: hypothetical protein D6694_15860 [Gammaproteobacteria bacterium]|nr:MAG: hypothetical protein D6694_15860 [Gammaproteobacteria bacterium]
MEIHDPQTNHVVDAFARELALALRRITGYSGETPPEKNLPQALQDPDEKTLRNDNNGFEEI